jgi:hypothetical protein
VFVPSIQNSCLLMKVLHRLHVQTASPWARWRWAMISDGSVADDSRTTAAGEHWGVVRSLVPLYRSVTRVSIGDGRWTSFWHDSRLPGAHSPRPCASSTPAPPARR